MSKKSTTFLQQASISTVLVTWSLWKNMDLSELGGCLHERCFYITRQFRAFKPTQLIIENNSTTFLLIAQ